MMSALHLTTLPANGQHWPVPISAQARNSRSGVNSGGIGMAERVVC
jgi:hypothetical protein